MARQITVYPISAEIMSGGSIRIEVKPGTFYNCNYARLRPKNEDAEAVLEDILARAKRNDKCRLGDMDWDGEGEPWFFEYKEKIAGTTRSKPDPDQKILRYYEDSHGASGF